MSEFVSLGDVVRFGITINNPAASGALVNADETPRFYAYRNNLDTAVIQGDFVARSNLVGTYRGSGIFSTGNGFSAGDYVEVHASGKLNGAVNRAIVKSFVINDIFDANVVQVSGNQVVPTELIEVNVVQVSGVPVMLADNIYFANIKFVKDSLTPRDEYTVSWYKNAALLPSGQITNSALSVYHTNANTSLFTNQKLEYFSVNHGATRYNDSTNLSASGEPYIAIASGTIDGATRTWANIIGLDYL